MRFMKISNVYVQPATMVNIATAIGRRVHMELEAA